MNGSAYLINKAPAAQLSLIVRRKEKQVNTAKLKIRRSLITMIVLADLSFAAKARIDNANYTKALTDQLIQEGLDSAPKPEL